MNLKFWEKRSSIRDPQTVNLFGVVPSITGSMVTPESAEAISACFACVQAISETVATLPLHTYRRVGQDRVKATDHPVYALLHHEPNEYQTALEFREQMTSSVLLRGNAYAEIEWDARGYPTSLHPIHPDRVTVLKLSNGRIGYEVANDQGKARRINQDSMLHLKDRTENSVVGKSRIQIHRDTIGLAIAQQAHGGKVFENGARLSGVLQTPHQMTDGMLARLKASWQSQYSGTDNIGKTAILEDGLTYQQIGMSLEDAQWIAAQKFSVEQVARIYRVPPTMIGDLTHGNFSNSVEMSRVFVTNTLRRWLVMWEQAVSRVLLTPNERGDYFAEHSVEGLLRGDATNRAAFYTQGIQAGWLQPSEARAFENLPTIEGLDNAKQTTDTQAAA